MGRGLYKKKSSAKKGIAGAQGATGSVGGTGTVNQVAYWSGTPTLAGDANFLWDAALLEFSVGDLSSDTYFHMNHVPGPALRTDLSLSTGIITLGDIAGTGSLATIIVDNDTGGNIALDTPGFILLGGAGAGPLLFSSLIGVGTRMVTVNNLGVISSATPISGTGTAGQVTYYTGASGITSDTSFLWDTTNKIFIVGDPTPVANGTVLTVDDSTTNIILNAVKVSLPGLVDYANNAAALAGGLVAGDLYHTTGTVKVVI